MAADDDKAHHAGMALREIRRRLEISQEALQERSGVSQATLSRYEHGQDMYLGNAVQVAEALGITLDELAGRSPYAPPAQPPLSEPATPKDSYPNRGRLRALPEYEAAPAEVRALIEALPAGGEDLTFFEWIDELRLFSALHAKGQLARALRARASSTTTEPSRSPSRQIPTKSRRA